MYGVLVRDRTRRKTAVLFFEEHGRVVSMSHHLRINQPAHVCRDIFANWENRSDANTPCMLSYGYHLFGDIFSTSFILLKGAIFMNVLRTARYRVPFGSEVQPAIGQGGICH